MGCPRCGSSQPQRQVPPPSASRPGTTVPRPAQTPGPQGTNRDTIMGLRYVPSSSR